MLIFTSETEHIPLHDNIKMDEPKMGKQILSIWSSSSSDRSQWQATVADNCDNWQTTVAGGSARRK